MTKKILDKLRRPNNIEPIVVAICLLVSLAWAGKAFFGSTLEHPAYPVTLVASDSTRNYVTHSRSVGDFFAEIGIQPGVNDLVNPAVDANVTRNMVITYRKAIPVKLVDSGGPAKLVHTSGTTICDLLDQCGITRGPLDRIEPPPSAPLEPGITVKITRVETIDFTGKKEIPVPQVSEPDPNLRRGETQEVQPGSPGLVEETTRVFYRNGEETQRISVSSRTLVEPSERVVRFGTQSTSPLISRGGVVRGTFTMVATAYDPGPGSCGASADGLTATGAIARKGVCAVDPRVIPLGTRLWIEGYGYALACDVGGAIKGNRIDVCFDTRAEAMRWGRKRVEVRIIE